MAFSQYTLKSAACQQGHLLLQAIILHVHVLQWVYSQVSLQWTPLGPAACVLFWEISSLRHLQLIWVQEKTGCILKRDTWGDKEGLPERPMKSCFWLRDSSWGNKCSRFAKKLSFKENKIVWKQSCRTNAHGLVHVITTLTGIKFWTGIIEDQIL